MQGEEREACDVCPVTVTLGRAGAGGRVRVGGEGEPSRGEGAVIGEGEEQGAGQSGWRILGEGRVDRRCGQGGGGGWGRGEGRLGGRYDTWAPRSDGGNERGHIRRSVPQPLAGDREGPSKGGPSRVGRRTTTGAAMHRGVGGLDTVRKGPPLPSAGDREGPSTRGPSRTGCGSSSIAVTHQRQSSSNDDGSGVPLLSNRGVGGIDTARKGPPLPCAGDREGPSTRGPFRTSCGSSRSAVAHQRQSNSNDDGGRASLSLEGDRGGPPRKPKPAGTLPRARRGRDPPAQRAPKGKRGASINDPSQNAQGPAGPCPGTGSYQRGHSPPEGERPCASASNPWWAGHSRSRR